MLETIIASAGFFCFGYLFGSRMYLYFLDPNILKKQLEQAHQKTMEKSRIDQRHLFEKYKSGLEDYYQYREKLPIAPKGLPNTSLMGDLRFLEVFDYYDGPRIFTCVNTNGEIFLALSVEDNVKSSKERWFYSKLSADRLSQLKKGEKDLYQAFKEAETGFVIEITIDAAGHREAKVSIQFIKDLDLPLPGEKLYYKPDIVDDEVFFSASPDKSVN